MDRQDRTIKCIRKAGGEVKLFSMRLSDETGKVNATCWHDDAEKFFPMFEEGKVGREANRSTFVGAIRSRGSKRFVCSLITSAVDLSILLIRSTVMERLTH